MARCRPKPEIGFIHRSANPLIVGRSKYAGNINFIGFFCGFGGCNGLRENDKEIFFSRYQHSNSTLTFLQYFSHNQILPCLGKCIQRTASEWKRRKLCFQRGQNENNSTWTESNHRIRFILQTVVAAFASIVVARALRSSFLRRKQWHKHCSVTGNVNQQTSSEIAEEIFPHVLLASFLFFSGHGSSSIFIRNYSLSAFTILMGALPFHFTQKLREKSRDRFTLLSKQRNNRRRHVLRNKN